MMKKILTVAAAGAMLLSAGLPAFGFEGFGGGGGGWSWGGTYIHNVALVDNLVDTNANTGFNAILGMKVMDGAIDTGDATALSGVDNQLNLTLLGCGCVGKLVISNDAMVYNTVDTNANTGFNLIAGLVVNGGDLDTGDAGAQSVVANLVNYTETGFGI